MLGFLLLATGSGGSPSPSTGLPTVQDLKDYLRIETTAEDALLASILGRALAMIEGWIGVPVTAEEGTFTDRAEYAAGVVPRSLVLPVRPIGASDAVPIVVTDGDGEVVDSTTYTVDATAGILWGKRRTVFPNGPYEIVALYGLSLMPRYAALEPMIAEVIIDIAADLYQRRTPSAASETGAGTSITWDVSRDVSGRALKTLRLLKLPVVM